MWLRLVRTFALCLSASLLPPHPLLLAQQSPSPASAPYTLHTQSRIVLLDVTVTDRNGTPVHGLPQSSFHIVDDKQPETVRHFEGNTVSDTSPSVKTQPHAPGVYSNDFLLHAPPALNILLLDISNLAIEDQMVLHIQLMRLMDALPGDQPLAIYTRSSGACILLQDFTTDRELLRAATRRALPRLFQHNPYLDDFDTLHQIATTVAQLPGRKNIFWFSGGAPLVSIGAIQGDPLLRRDNLAVRAAYDELEAARIAVYPVDARGLTVTGGLAQQIQHTAMDDVAQATGGHALYNNNGIAEFTARTLESDRSFYTLTYSPQNFRADRKWHNIRVLLDDPSLRLSYRSGYFSDNSGPTEPETKTPETRPRLLADGTLNRQLEQPASTPIIFEAEVLPATAPAITQDTRPVTRLGTNLVAHHGSVPYSIRYTVPAGSFAIRSVQGKPSIVLDVAAIAFNSNGTAIAHTAQTVTLNINPAHLPIPSDTTLPLLQQLALGKGDVSLFLAVWDTASGRMGTLQIPLKVTRPQR